MFFLCSALKKVSCSYRSDSLLTMHSLLLVGKNVSLTEPENSMKSMSINKDLQATLMTYPFNKTSVVVSSRDYDLPIHEYLNWFL